MEAFVRGPQRSSPRPQWRPSHLKQGLFPVKRADSLDWRADRWQVDDYWLYVSYQQKISTRTSGTFIMAFLGSLGVIYNDDCLGVQSGTSEPLSDNNPVTALVCHGEQKQLCEQKTFWAANPGNGGERMKKKRLNWKRKGVIGEVDLKDNKHRATFNYLTSTSADYFVFKVIHP